MLGILFIALLALVIFGPAKLPELARQVSKYQAQFRRMKRELTGQLEAEISTIRIAEEGKDAVASPLEESARTATRVGQLPTSRR